MAVKPSLPSGKGQKNTGNIGDSYKFDKPREAIDKGIPGMSSLHDDIGEKSGFESNTSAYIVKKGTPYGEAAKFNMLPPGMDISDQDISDQRDMPFKKITEMGYPGGGWEPAPRDIEE